MHDMENDILNQIINKKINPDKFKNKVLSEDLSAFIQKVFYTINPGTKYLHNWHIDLFAEYLQEIQKRNIKRLIVNIPPRSLKSVCFSVAFPAWLLGKNPSERIIVASYSETLSLKHSTDCRIVVSSKWFKNLFPSFELSSSQNEKNKFATTENGYRFATSVGGTLTGEGGNYIIVDDPHNPQQVFSDKYRKKTLEWFSNTLSSRLNDKKNGVIIVVMQRLHPEDLSGYLLKTAGKLWHLLSLPAIAEKDELIEIGNFKKFRKKGDFLHKDRESKDEIERIKIEMGTYTFLSQYQQNPLPKSGLMVKPIWFKRFLLDKVEDFNFITLSFDTAIKAGINNDSTVCTVWGEKENNFYLLKVYKDKVEYPDLKKLALEIAEEWSPNAILIEDKASGQSLIQDLKRETKLPIIAIKVKNDKITRFASITALIESGKVFLPEKADWLMEFEMEIYNFPNVEHDDQVDSTTQFLDWIRARQKTKEHYGNIRRL